MTTANFLHKGYDVIYACNNPAGNRFTHWALQQSIAVNSSPIIPVAGLRIRPNLKFFYLIQCTKWSLHSHSF